MVISAYLQPAAPGASKRRSARRKLQLEVKGSRRTEAGMVVKIHNISLSGMLIECDAALGVDEQFDVDLPHVNLVSTKVIWSSGHLYGCEFEKPISSAALSAAQLRGTAASEEPDEASSRSTTMTAHPSSSAFGENLKRLRMARGLSQANVAAHLGVSAPSISGWEKGRARPKRDRLVALAELLDVPESQLLVDLTPVAFNELIEQGRDRIARATGANPDQIRIFIEI